MRKKLNKACQREGPGAWLFRTACCPVLAGPALAGAVLSAVELIEFHNSPHIPAGTKCLAGREASQKGNRMAIPRLGTAVSLPLSISWLRIASCCSPARVPQARRERVVSKIQLPSVSRGGQHLQARPLRALGLPCTQGFNPFQL